MTDTPSGPATGEPRSGHGPWLTMEEATARLRFKSRFGIYKWIAANGIERMRRGRQWLIAKRDVDAALRGDKRVRGGRKGTVA